MRTRGAIGKFFEYLKTFGTTVSKWYGAFPAQGKLLTVDHSDIFARNTHEPAAQALAHGEIDLLAGSELAVDMGADPATAQLFVGVHVGDDIPHDIDGRVDGKR